MTKNLIHWWLTPKFPQKHIDNILLYKPEGLNNKIRNYYRTWFVHPFRRRAAKLYCFILQKLFGMKVIGITGSTGKTTTKEMLASILKLHGETVYSFANIDPIYNIPTTIFRCKPSTRYLILEMGVEYLNEMDFYLWLVKPNVGVITNIYPTHTLNFGNEEGVFKEKSKLARNLTNKSIIVLNSENKYLQKLRGKIQAKILWFGGSSSITASDVKHTIGLNTKFRLSLEKEKFDVVIPVLGKQFVTDALAAAAAALALYIDIRKIKNGLQEFEIQSHRMNIRKLKSGAILIDDSYNNNPEAAKGAIKTLKEVAGSRKTMLIFGDMLELGKKEKEYHEELRNYIKNLGISYVIGVGKLAKYVATNPKFQTNNWQDVMEIVEPFLMKNTVVLIKGSRSTNLDKLADNLK